MTESRNYKFAKAFEDRNFKEVERLVDEGIDVNFTSWRCETPPLCMALRFGQVSLATRLIKLGADIHYIDDRGYSMLMYATIDYDLAKKLIELNVNIHHSTDGVSALTTALSHGQLDLADELLDLGVDCTLKREYGTTMLFGLQDQDMIKRLLDSKVDVNAQEQYGSTALSYAIGRDRFETAEFLIRAKANVNVCNSQVSVLYHAIIRNQEELITTIVAHGADLDFIMKNRHTALTYFCQNNEINNVKRLLELGANVNVMNGYGLLPLNYVKNQGLIAILVEAGGSLSKEFRILGIILAFLDECVDLFLLMNH